MKNNHANKIWFWFNELTWFKFIMMNPTTSIANTTWIFILNKFPLYVDLSYEKKINRQNYHFEIILLEFRDCLYPMIYIPNNTTFINVICVVQAERWNKLNRHSLSSYLYDVPSLFFTNQFCINFVFF